MSKIGVGCFVTTGRVIGGEMGEERMTALSGDDSPGTHMTVSYISYIKFNIFNSIKY